MYGFHRAITKYEGQYVYGLALHVAIKEHWGFWDGGVFSLGGEWNQGWGKAGAHPCRTGRCKSHCYYYFYSLGHHHWWKHSEEGAKVQGSGQTGCRGTGRTLPVPATGVAETCRNVLPEHCFFFLVGTLSKSRLVTVTQSGRKLDVLMNFSRLCISGFLTCVCSIYQPFTRLFGLGSVFYTRGTITG